MRVLQSWRMLAPSQTLTSPDWKYVQWADIIPGYIQNKAGRLQASRRSRLGITPNIMFKLHDWVNSASIDCRYRANITRRCRDALVAVDSLYIPIFPSSHRYTKDTLDQEARWRPKHQVPTKNRSRLQQHPSPQVMTPHHHAHSAPSSGTQTRTSNRPPKNASCSSSTPQSSQSDVWASS